MQESEAPQDAWADCPVDPMALREVLVTAERFLACRERVEAQARWIAPPPVMTLAEAIERDFAGFDMERAESEFRAALEALSSGPPPQGWSQRRKPSLAVCGGTAARRPQGPEEDRQPE